MYIVKTTTGEAIKIDYDELPKLSASPDTMIFFRQGAVLRRLIGVVVLDEEAEKEIMKRPGESAESVQQRLREKKSEDIFENLRRKNLPPGPKQLNS